MKISAVVFAQHTTTREFFKMTRYVAFLGSINVGGDQLKMAALREVLEAKGVANFEKMD